MREEFSLKMKITSPEMTKNDSMGHTFGEGEFNILKKGERKDMKQFCL